MRCTRCIWILPSRAYDKNVCRFGIRHYVSRRSLQTDHNGMNQPDSVYHQERCLFETLAGISETKRCDGMGLLSTAEDEREYWFTRRNNSPDNSRELCILTERNWRKTVKNRLHRPSWTLPACSDASRISKCTSNISTGNRTYACRLWNGRRLFSILRTSRYFPRQ